MTINTSLYDTKNVLNFLEKYSKSGPRAQIESKENNSNFQSQSWREFGPNFLLKYLIGLSLTPVLGSPITVPGMKVKKSVIWSFLKINLATTIEKVW